ncbi:unnamed protein product, partial [Rotaria sp. Silwood2]
GGMKGADIGVGWVDQKGTVHFQDRYAFGMSRPVIDNTTTDWFHLQGREQNGWTSIQFKRLLDTCDSMDVPIKSGTNVLIFAYGFVDPDLSRSDGDISYHGTRRGTRMIPLRSYGDPPLEKQFAGLESFEFRARNYRVPSDESTYYCKVYKAPTHFPAKRHAVATYDERGYFFCLDRVDNSGIRFYIGNELRQHDLGYLSFGTGPSPVALAIPPQVNRFIVDSYCSPTAG